VRQYVIRLVAEFLTYFFQGLPQAMALDCAKQFASKA
jgi:hypothetical protein